MKPARRITSFGILILASCLLAGVAAARAAGQSDKTAEVKESKAPVLDINRASAQDFATLPGIGPKLAARIVAYRKRHGPFRRTQDLIVIRGMSARKWRAIRSRLMVEKKSQKPEAKK